VRERLCALTARLDWLWITGNHDVGMAETPGGRRMVEAEVDGIWLRHEADPVDPRPEISGHFHPKFRLSLRGRHVSRRCFVGSSSKLILPALGALTGGLDAGHGEIRRAVGPGAMALVPVADRMLRFPLG
jgi:metallophosphoesterase superfamily enzyme